MINTSSLYKDLVQQSGRMFKAKLIVTFADGTETELTDENIMQDSLSLVSSTSDEGAFSIGCAIIGQLDFEIDNSDGTYDNMSFEDAEIDVRIGLVTKQKYDGTLETEWLDKGIFTVEEVTVNENYISITAYDNMAKLDVPFADAGVSFPITLFALYQKICTHCGVAYDAVSFANAGIRTTGEHIEEEASCRDVLSYIAQLACSYAYATTDGEIKIGWYSETGYEITEQQKLNGTVTVSGVQLTDVEGKVYIKGSKKYCIMIEDNPLAIDSTALQSTVWNQRLIGLNLTPFSSELLSDPSLETGDIVTVSDIHGNQYKTPITNITYHLDSKMTVACDAETVKEKSRTTCSPSAKILAQANKKMAQKISEYDVRAKQFSELMANAMGFFQTDVTQSDGSTISYLHDKPDITDSVIIWKKSIDGFAVSTDGGKTYKAGFDSEGNAVVNILAAVGIIANWITAGTIKGIEVISDAGQIAGWKLNGTKLISTDGSIVLDSRNNTITFNDSKGVFVRINNNGVAYFRPDDNEEVKEIGNIGITKGANTNTYGITFNLVDGDAMTWSLRDKNTGYYYNKLRYEAKSNKLILNCDLEVNGNVTTANLTDGIRTGNSTPFTGEVWALKSMETDPEGKITSRTGGNVVIKNGLVVSW